MNKIFSKIFLGIIVSFLFFPVVSVKAAVAPKFIDPAFDPSCWTEKDCANARETIFGASKEDAKNGFLPNSYPCVKKGWGKCLPAGTTKTSISFGGKTEFTDIGEYLVTVYNYALRIAAILAVIMVIVAGVQYVTSGGNSEMVNSAKKRIVGSLIGLFIAYMSFFILNSINPALVNLRLPQVFLLRPFTLNSEFCVDLPKETLLARVPDSISVPDRLDVEKMRTAFGGITDFNIQPSSLITGSVSNCGEMYFIKDSPALACRADYCLDGVCMQTNDVGSNYTCAVGVRVAGKISNSSIPFFLSMPCAEEGWTWPWVKEDGLTGLLAVCNNGSNDSEGKITIKNLSSNTQSYEAQLSKQEIDSLAATCETKAGGLKGFGILMNVNENCDIAGEFHVIGRSGVDLGDMSLWADNGIFKFAQVFMSISHERAAKLKKELFFTAEEVKKGVRLNIDVRNVNDIDLTEERSVYNPLMQ